MTKSGFASGQLRSFVERVERLEEEKKALSTDIAEIYAEAKGGGFDVKIMREIVKLRKLDGAERMERDAILDLYKSALGMLSDTPLGEATLERVAREVKSGKRSKGLAESIADLGTPVDLTEDEKAKGVTAAFVKNGTRMSIGLGSDREKIDA